MLINDHPTPGETVLHCGHLENMRPEEVHYYRSQFVFTYKRPNGTEGYCSWILCCHSCFGKAGGDGSKVALRAEAVWDGSVAAVRTNVGDIIRGKA